MGERRRRRDQRWRMEKSKEKIKWRGVEREEKLKVVGD